MFHGYKTVGNKYYRHLKGATLLNTKLKVGRITYANLFPVFYYLETECDCLKYRFTRGVPSKLNKMLRNRELDISPSSSIEYLKNRDRYMFLPGLSISSKGPIKSILLFSKFPIEQLGGKKIALTTESATSVALLKVIMKEFISLKCKYSLTDLHSVRNIFRDFPAVLHIGDTAMIEASKQSKAGARRSADYIYDLGELWNNYTGLPFVYALWLIRKKTWSENRELTDKLASDLLKAKKFLNRNLSLIAREAPQKKWLSEKELISYWKIISYDLTEKHMEGLRLFEEYVKRL